jgi:AraC-like DNA-binding protein
MISVPELVHISHYQAPSSRNHMPRIIPSGRQDIEIVTGGRGYFEYEGRLLEVTPGMILWHKPGDQTIYLTDLKDPYECIVVVLQDDNGVLMPRVSQWTDRGLFQKFIDEILTEYHSENPDRRKLACYIYGQLCWQSKTHVESTQANHKRNVEMKWVGDWIEKHFAEEIQMMTLSDMAGISIPHLHTLFKQFTGKTPYQFILARRLQEAKILLASTRLAVKEIAVKSGFPDVGNFCRIFKQCYGVTAQVYRLKHTDTR